MKTVRVNNAHNKDALEGLIFFSERMRELLAHSTDDSFKVSALNTPGRARELERLLRHTYATTQKAQALSPLLEELADSIRSDYVIQTMHNKNVLLRMVDEVKDAVSENKPRLILEAADSLAGAIGLLSNYMIFAQDLLLNVIISQKEKKKISAVSDSLVVQLQSHGYSREYIRHISKTCLAAKLSKQDEIDVKTVISEFFSKFTGERKKYTGITRCRLNLPEEAGRSSRLEFSKKPNGFDNLSLLELADGTSHEQGGLNMYALRTDIEACDAFSARESFFTSINANNSIYQFLNHSPIAYFAHDCLIKDVESGKELRIRRPTNVMLRGQTRQTLTVTDQTKTKDLISAIGNLSDSSKKSLISALRFHKEALDSSSLENQLIDLWAALEGFVPQPIDESPRIGSVLDHILPSQILVYAEKKFRYVVTGVKNAGAQAADIINSLPCGDVFDKRVAALIVCPEFSGKLDELLKLPSVSPLLRYRMFSLFENFSTRGKAKEELLRHRKRLEWQIRRIYITRNTLMHSATSHGDLDVLVENLHSYLDILLNSVTRMTSIMGGKTTINAILKALSAAEKTYLKSLDDEKEGTLTPKNFACIFFSDTNPLLNVV
ncbi:hypothetical protein [Paraburkholderia gardini]|uniref:hypothetical protein n=1 Tax=Paraburkholderia gardini TaxID=2823469 RepID=UPI001DC045E0|nr:hypothetical protein [Paraburkholderia gardini]CAG4918311.1 hypothetical protein R69919_04605 [Paraburkholderia gardini]